MDTNLIIFFIVMIIIFCTVGYLFILKKNKTKTNEDFKPITNKFENNKKVINYFGGDYCPFSNNNSNAYKIMTDFETEYGDSVTVNYYWAGKDNELMKALNVKYVPTILNGNNEIIELKLPEDVDTAGLSNDELRTMLLENIYNKL
jgi:hypothetical protein